MTLLLIEGFDDGLMAQKGWGPAYQTNMPSIVTGRFGGSAIQIAYTSGVVGPLGQTVTSELVIGVAMQPNVVSLAAYILVIGNATLQLQPGGGIALLRSDTKAQVAATMTPVWTGSVWRYLELKYTVSSGACELRVDGLVVLSGSVPAISAVSSVTFPDMMASSYNTTTQMLVDDIYVLDTSGTTNNDYLGDVRVSTLLPASDGTHHDMTPSSGTTHYTLVDEATPDTTSYVTATSSGEKETYHFQPLSSTVGGVYGVRTTAYAHMDGAGVAGLRNLITNGGSDYEGTANVPLSASWSAASEIWEQNPATSVPWSQESVNDSEFGVEST